MWNNFLHENIISSASFNLCCEFKLTREIETQKLNLGIRKKSQLAAIGIKICAIYKICGEKQNLQWKILLHMSPRTFCNIGLIYIFQDQA